MMHATQSHAGLDSQSALFALLVPPGGSGEKFVHADSTNYCPNVSEAGNHGGCEPGGHAGVIWRWCDDPAGGTVRAT